MNLPTIIDVEASGFGQGSYPIEIGFVTGDGTPHCFLVAPERSWTRWDRSAEELHGISRSVLEDHGRPGDEVAGRMNALLRGEVVYSDAWVYDMSWVGKLFDAVDMAPTFRIADLRELLSPAQCACWQQAKVRVLERFKPRRHRASNDARVLQECYRESLEMVATC